MGPVPAVFFARLGTYSQHLGATGAFYGRESPG